MRYNVKLTGTWSRVNLRDVNNTHRRMRSDYVHVLRRHLELILAEGVEPTQRDIRVGDAVLPSREQLEVVA